MYADDFISVLSEVHAAGQPTYIGMISPPVYGLMVTLNSDDSNAVALKGALERAQIAFTFTYETLDTRNADIVVGLKPLDSRYGIQ
jgi:hypothetical protein